MLQSCCLKCQFGHLSHNQCVLFLSVLTPDYAVIKLKLNLFHIMTNVSHVLLFLLAILLQCISRDNTVSCFLTSFVFIMSPIVSELTLHAVFLCFRFRYFTNQIPTLHKIINLVSFILCICFCFCFNMEIEKVTLDQITSKLITYRVITGVSIVYWLKIYLRFLKLKHTTHDFMISSAYQKLTLMQQF